ncbi:MAG: hypothetical protein IK054_05830 [Lachnospiraceae bacterium]|nr:hypothetical protein [Lachnospiraceae bacterium]
MAKTKNTSEMARRNSAAMICYLVVIAIIALAYLLEVIKGSRTVGYFLLVFLTLWIPAVICIILKARNPEDDKLKYIIMIGFAIPWAIMLFTASNNLVFTYALVLLISLNAYADKRFALMAAIVYNVINVASVVFIALTQGISKDSLVTIEIQTLLMLICGIFNFFIAKAGVAINEDKMAIIEKEKNTADQLLSQIINVSGEITNGIGVMTGKMQVLDESMERTCSAMEEVRTGTGESAESAQTQMVMTAEIQNRIGEVSDHADAIAESVKETGEAVAAGTDNMNNLEREVEQAKKNSDAAAEELANLETYTKKVTDIIELINSVASQTSLLSLNASIEAARAGEAGRGFAVVASEISNLANQTQDATNDISDLISNIESKLMDVTKAIRTFIEGSERQQEAARETAKSFETIKNDTTKIADNAKGLSASVKSLSEANDKIVETVQNISAIMEEVSAHSSETFEASEHNTRTVDEVLGIVEELQKQAEILKQHA